MTKEFLVVLEKGPTSYGAFAPDVEGCFAVGTTPEETLQRFQEALLSHLHLLQEEGELIPGVDCSAAYVEVVVPVVSLGGASG